MTDIIRTYRRDAVGKLRFRQTWAMDGPPTTTMAVHCGVVGNSNGSFREIRVDDRVRHVTEFLADARAEGYAPVPEEDHQLVVMQCRLTGPRGDTAADWILTHGANAVSEHLGRRGLGHVDGRDHGGGLLNIFCPVVDVPLAVTALSTVGNRNPRFKGRFTIGIRDTTGDWTTAWPEPGTFALF